MIVVETRPMADGRIYRRRHCFACGEDAVGLEKVTFVGKRTHPRAFGKIYAVTEAQISHHKKNGEIL